MKYIIFKSGDLLKPIIFPDHIAHSEIICKNAIPVSAGFFKIDFGDITVYGESVSLKLKPRKQDNELIKISLLNTVPIKLFLNK